MIPDVIHVSPYIRTVDTLESIIKGWPELKNVKTYEEERIRELEHGLLLLYNDRKVFFTLHPEQRLFYESEGPYWYRYPQGESKPNVRERNRSWTATLIREFAGRKVLAITHHLNILSTMANFERWSAWEFIRWDREQKPVNCGVTLYRGNSDKGDDGRLELDFYNEKYY